MPLLNHVQGRRGHLLGACKVDSSEVDFLEAHKDFSPEQLRLNLPDHFPKGFVVRFGCSWHQFAELNQSTYFWSGWASAMQEIQASKFSNYTLGTPFAHVHLVVSQNDLRIDNLAAIRTNTAGQLEEHEIGIFLCGHRNAPQ